MRGRGVGVVAGVAVIAVAAVLGVSTASYLVARSLPSQSAPPPPPPPPSGCAIKSGFWVCHAPPASGVWVAGYWVWVRVPPPADATHWLWMPGHAPATSTTAVQADSSVPVGPSFPGSPGPVMVGPSKPHLVGQPAPQVAPMLLVVLLPRQVEATSLTVNAIMSDWPGAGQGTVTISVYVGSTANACASPPLATRTAAAADRGTWSTTFGGLATGTYELQAIFDGARGPMVTPCGRSSLTVGAAPGSAR